MAAAGPHLQACEAGLKQLTDYLISSQGGLTAGKQQLAQIQSRILGAAAAVDRKGTGLLGPAEQRVLQAAVGACVALADGRHERSWEWLQLLTVVMQAVEAAEDSCFGIAREQEPAVRPMLAAWLAPQCATLLPSMTQLLAGICTVVADAPAGTPADAQVRRAAFGCLYTLVLLLHAAYVGSQTPPAHRLLPTVEAATSLAFLLVNGVTYSGQEGSSCSCCLDGRRQAASGPPAAHQLLVRGEGLGSLLGPLAQLHGCAANQDGTFEADRLALVSRGAYALDLQHLALQLAAARKARRRGARRTPPAAATPSCANLSAFFVTGQPDDSVALRCPADPHQLLLLTVNAVMTLTAIIDPLKCAQACPHCTPEQMLLLLEASTQHCQLDFDLATGQDLLLSISSLHDEVLHLRAGAPWMPEFRRRAAPTLSAFVAAAAQQLSGSQGAAGAGSSRSGAVCRSDLALAAQYAARMLACGGGLLEAPGEGDWALVERLLPCLEPVVRCLDACMQADGELCLNILTAVVIHTPDTFDELWRSGCLPGLIVTTAKLSGVEEGDEEGSEEWDGDGGEGWGLAQLMAARPLLSAVLPAPGQAQPWFAASAERQQFTLLALGRIGAKAAAVVQGQGMRVGLEGLLAMATDLLQLAAGQLSGQPLLRQQLEAAAPKLLQQAANMKAELRLPPSVDGQPRAPMMLLAALAQQLDPLALGLALPGCYNPACTSLAGASEAGMPLKTCMGCKTARYCGLACAKQHWKHHKASCKRAAAARETAAGEQGQQQAQGQA